MTRIALPLLLAASLALGGCAASIAAGLVGAAVRAASPSPREVAYSADRLAAAREACRVRAAQHGAVHIIDAEQGRVYLPCQIHYQARFGPQETTLVVALSSVDASGGSRKLGEYFLDHEFESL